MSAKEKYVRVENVTVVTEESITIHEICHHTGVDAQVVQELVSLGILEPVQTLPEPIFFASSVLRINKILRIQSDLGVALHSMPVVLELLDRVEALEQELKRYR